MSHYVYSRWATDFERLRKRRSDTPCGLIIPRAADSGLLQIEDHNDSRRDFATTSYGDKVSLSGNNRNATVEDGRVVQSIIKILPP
jgi:hypothetical protein